MMFEQCPIAHGYSGLFHPAMRVPFIHHFLKCLRRVFVAHRAPGRYLWAIWCFFARQDARNISTWSKSNKKSGTEEETCRVLDSCSVRFGKEDGYLESDTTFNCGSQSISPKDSVFACASEVPSNLHSSPCNSRRAIIPSYELQTTNIREDFSFESMTYLLKDEDTQWAADSPLPSTSRLDQPVNVPQLDTDPDRVSGPAQELTTGPGLMEGEEGIVGGYNLAPITTSPVEESGHTTLEAEVAGFRNKTLSEMCDDFHPMAPEIYYRYYKEDYIEPLVTTYELAPMTMRFQTRCLPPGWKEFIHHEGARYFLYESKRIYTDADIYNPSVQQHARRLINEFDKYTRIRNIVLTPNMNVVFDMFYDSEDGTCPCRYYIVDHTTRSVFWLDKFDADQLQVWEEVKGVTELTHIRHAIESQYWYHCHLFPDSFCMGEAEVDELKDIITYWICDVLTSQGSTSPYEPEKLQNILSLTNNLSKNLQGGAAAYARLMHLFARQRFLDFYGQPTVRLDRQRSIHLPGDSTSSQPWLLGYISPLMFSAPNVYYGRIKEVYIDRCVHFSEWQSMISRMVNEWGESILTGSVILTANVAFLAIQSVDSAAITPNRSPAQILSFVSVAASIGCIVTGLLLVRKNKSINPGSMVLSYSLKKLNVSRRSTFL
ncbi:hypothetical protein E1B28_010437 [Marasmius oreades]|uniref:WW domain-containing protein n=1 Tax=Marasmius oreades TaxID=181124 RepID=A0A9P7URS3_9AGAR|nr:uncharacterized protein E1B28_010437 [Marasmius oreades]KAG7091400.1 hypothetical protein E1B28_010437 [Marasmius oreades]